MQLYALEQWPRAHGEVLGRARLRVQAEDFVVEEELPFEPEGEGEHIYLQVRKTDTNTAWLAKRIARCAEVPARDVSYAGLKDRHAVTTQWFSVYLPGKAMPDWSALSGPETMAEVLQVTRHRSKLRRGWLRQNRFTIYLREFPVDAAHLQARGMRVRERGIPNYFGAQRFGREGRNLQQALDLFAGRWRSRDRDLRGILLSAARAWIFNQVLAQRVADGSWDQALDGECFNLDGSASFFCPESVDAALLQRLAAHDVHPTGPMWGRGSNPCRGECAQREAAVLAALEEYGQGLEKAGLEQERRALRVVPRELDWQARAEGWVLRFALPRGCYATGVVREFAQVDSLAAE